MVHVTMCLETKTFIYHLTGKSNFFLTYVRASLWLDWAFSFLIIQIHQIFAIPYQAKGSLCAPPGKLKEANYYYKLKYQTTMVVNKKRSSWLSYF